MRGVRRNGYTDVPVKYNHGDSRGTPARTTSKTERGRLTISVLPDRVDVRRICFLPPEEKIYTLKFLTERWHR